MSSFADCVFRNGQVVTLDADSRVCRAVAVKGDRILRVGADEAMRDVAGPKTRVVDLKGRSLVPGFIDAHIHMDMGVQDLGLTLRYPDVRSLEDIYGLVRDAVAKTPPGQIIRGWGYDQNRLTEKRHPTRRELDAIAPDHPVALIRTCEHMSVHNSRSLALAGVREDEGNPPGGEICRDADGRMNGLMKETANVRMMRAMPFSEEEFYQGLLTSDTRLCRYGITSVHEVGVKPHHLRLFQKGIREGAIHVRVYACPYSDTLGYVRDFMKSGVLTGFGDDRLRIGALKTMLDGSSSGPSSAMREPYASDPASQGILYMDQATLDGFVDEAHRLGYQVSAHAVGDAAVEQMVSAIEKALRANPRADHRHRIEHCALVDDDLMDRIRKAGIVPIGQPVFLYEFGDAYRVHYGDERANRMFRGRAFQERGIVAAAGSDSPVTSADPLLGVHVAVNRATQSGQALSPNERLSVMEALRLYTVNAAYAAFEEKMKGSIEPGKLADLTVLSEPLLDVPADEIKNVRAEATMIGGSFVFGDA